MDVQLRNLIVKNNIIAPEFCDSIVDKSKEWQWRTHQWYSHHEVQFRSHKQKELDVVFGDSIPDVVQKQLIMHISEVWKAYMMTLPELLQHEQGTNLDQGSELQNGLLVDLVVGVTKNQVTESVKTSE